MNIKKGDLAMVVKPSPCCGDTDGIGKIFAVEAVERAVGWCGGCFKQEISLDALQGGADVWWPLSVLKKIDPPEEGDNLPTRKDIENKELV